jgi:putative endonuclease
MTHQRQNFGRLGESLAERHLRNNGYEIVCRNYRTRFGEIDIIARDRDTIVFVEVKARSSTAYGSAKAAITPHKRRKISMLALYYLKTTRQTSARARFDVVTISTDHGKPDVDVIKNAFELAYD